MDSQYRRYYKDDMTLDSERAPGGVVVYFADGDEEILHVNKYVIDLFECDSTDDFLELVQGSFCNFVYAEDLEAVEDSIWGQVGKNGSLDQIYYRIKTKTGRLVNVVDFGRLVDELGTRPVFYVFVAEMLQSGSIDWLTGLPSMARFHTLARMGSEAMWKRGEQPAAVALDLIGLKSFNTQNGRDEGDILLRVFADVLRNHFGSEACSRFAEDHYYAFAPLEGLDEKLKDVFADFKVANNGKVLPIRAGVYGCERDDDIVAIGFDRAKIACDLDRKTWQSHVVWFSDEMRAKEQLRIHVLDRVEQAIEDGWVRPYYQGIVRSSTGYVCGEEALARWVDPEYGELSPSQFVPVLEEAGLLQNLDMYMVDCVLADMVTKREDGVAIVPVSVNISLCDLGRIDVAREVCKKADAAGVPHSLLRVEFTESAALDDPVFLRAQIEALHEAGFDVWMDDFGSGYSSLNTIREFDFDLIKLDMGFIRDIHGEKARDIVAGVVSVAKKLEVGTLAEGVETEEQALFLESIGCDMLQGFYYNRPSSIDAIVHDSELSDDLEREDLSEADYWDAVGAIDLSDPTATGDGRNVAGTPMSQFPAGVMEHRGDVWRVLRANKAYRELLDKGGVLPLTLPTLQANVIERGVGEEFAIAAERSLETRTWERVASTLEYGSDYQFYTKPIAATPDAKAFALASIPTMLGTALGSYGDVPVAYAIFRVVFDESGEEVVDAEYVYANSVYHEWGNFESDDLMGRSFIEVNADADAEVFSYMHQVVTQREPVHDTVYSSDNGHWLNISIAPSPIDGCCVVAFTIADEEHREREEIIVGRDTSNLIIAMADVFSNERSYEAAMNGVLAMLSRIIHPKRLFVFERGQGKNWITFEWCAPGARSQIEVPQVRDQSVYEAWDRLAGESSVINVADTAELASSDPELYRQLTKSGISQVVAVALRDDDDIIGYLVAENYTFEEGVDINRLLETVATFMSSRIINQRLVAELDRAGTHDVLTGLLNRRGFDRAIEGEMAEHPGEPYVLALMDIDDFKTVNDLYGHDVGDEALRALSRAVADAVPDTVVLGRNGGDEFVGVFFGDDALRAGEVFERFSQQELGCQHSGKWYRLSMSIGYAGYPAEAGDLKEAYTKADAALYSVKLAGKSGFKRYTPDLESQYRSQLGFTPRDISENVPGAILVHRAGGDGEILFANDELVDMFECDSLSDFMEYTGGTFAGIVYPEDAPRVCEELVAQVPLTDVGAKNFSDYRIITKKGTIKNVADNGRLVEIEDIGPVFYVLIIDRDERGN